MHRPAPTPLVSVLLPALDAAATLPACLRSLQRQTLRDWECVIVDDGSGDGTAAVARQIAIGDSRVRLVTQPHRGLVAALTQGLAHCRGTFVARMDADDVMHRDRLRLQAVMLMAQPTLAAVGCHVRLFPRDHLQAGARAYERWLNQIDTAAAVDRDAFVECPIAHPTLMIRRAVLARHGYRDCAWPEDYDLILRLLAAHEQVGVVPRRLLSWRDRPDRLSRRDPRYGVERFTACKAVYLAGGFLSHTDTYGLWGFGHTGRALCRALRVLGKRPAYIVEVHPGRLGNHIHGAPVVQPDALGALPRHPLVVCVAREGPRNTVRAALVDRGFAELRDFVCAA